MYTDKPFFERQPTLSVAAEDDAQLRPTVTLDDVDREVLASLEDEWIFDA